MGLIMNKKYTMSVTDADIANRTLPVRAGELTGRPAARPTGRTQRSIDRPRPVGATAHQAKLQSSR
jgi:hypothetical protein